MKLVIGSYLKDMQLKKDICIMDDSCLLHVYIYTTPTV